MLRQRLLIYSNRHALLDKPVLPLKSNIAPVLTNSSDNLDSWQSSEAIKTLLEQNSTLSLAAIDKVLETINCAKNVTTRHSTIENHNILSVIDYSKPSSEKRLWVFDLKEKTLIFNTYVSHGIKSGALLSTYFSNKYDSKASSIGIYKTDKIYHGRHGPSLKLEGLDRGFNDNASNRSIVIHGGWYVEDDFIKRYGRPGRSWGCPALPDTKTVDVINTIKDNSLMVIYYPNDRWFLKSRFLIAMPIH